jgi:Uma2 family endonuclease
MSISESGALTAADYNRLAWEYYQTLPLDHFMESVPHARQREIALASFALLKERRPDVQYFNELLVQYFHSGRFQRVVPDNMLVIGGVENPQRSNYAVEQEPARPFMMLEWVSSSSEGKDYEDSFRKYEQELQTPYCVMHHPDRRDLRVFHHEDGRYVQLEPDSRGRISVPELDLELGIKEAWVRFWHKGELLELPAEQERRLDNLMMFLRQLTKTKAAKAGRDDILAALDGADQAQLQSWLSELESA